MKPDFAPPLLAMGSDVVWIDAATPDPLKKDEILTISQMAEKYGVTLRDRLIGYLPRYAPYAAQLGWLLNLRDRVAGLAKLSEPFIGFSARRKLPRF